MGATRNEGSRQKYGATSKALMRSVKRRKKLPLIRRGSKGAYH